VAGARWRRAFWSRPADGPAGATRAEDRHKPPNRAPRENAVEILFADEIVNLLSTDPNATVKVRVEIRADFEGGVSDSTRRAVSENATSLGFTTKEWE
jgi:hypothetical protein